MLKERVIEEFDQHGLKAEATSGNDEHRQNKVAATTTKYPGLIPFSHEEAAPRAN